MSAQPPRRSGRTGTEGPLAQSRSRRTSAWSRFLEDSSFVREYFWKYRRPISVGLAALVLVDLLELLPPLILKDTIDAIVAGSPWEELLRFAAIYLGIALVQGVCRYAWRVYLIRSSILAGQDLRARFTGHLFGLSVSFFDRRRIGELMSQTTNDVEAVRMAIGAGMLTFADAAFYVLTVPVAMYLLSPKLMVLALLPMPLVPLLVVRNQREIHRRFQDVQGSFSQISAMAQEGLGGVRIVKGFAREDACIDRLGELGREYIRLNLKLSRVQSSFGPMLDFIMSLGLVLLLYVGGRGVIEQTVTLGTFVAFQRYIQKMAWPMMAVGMAISYFQRAVASSDRIKEVLAEQTDVPEPAEPASLSSGAPALSQAGSGAPGGPFRSSGAIEYRRLTFTFPEAIEPALRDIDLRVEPGSRVALVGGIGSGKSAMLALLPRVYPVADGMLFVDGIDVNRWPREELRKQIGYVSQDVFLFSDSVEENLAFGLTGDWPTLDRQRRIEESVRVAAFDEDVARLSEGYATRIGERGINLSGGQKQRMTLARALVREPPILILDDALSAVDVRTESRILRALRGRPGRNTELIAAHRLTTVQEADEILVLDRGRVIQRGTHGALVRQSGSLYAQFHEQQRLQADLENYAEEVAR